MSSRKTSRKSKPTKSTNDQSADFVVDGDVAGRFDAYAAKLGIDPERLATSLVEGFLARIDSLPEPSDDDHLQKLINEAVRIEDQADWIERGISSIVAIVNNLGPASDRAVALDEIRFIAAGLAEVAPRVLKLVGQHSDLLLHVRNNSPAPANSPVSAQGAAGAPPSGGALGAAMVQLHTESSRLHHELSWTRYGFDALHGIVERAVVHTSDEIDIDGLFYLATEMKKKLEVLIEKGEEHQGRFHLALRQYVPEYGPDMPPSTSPVQPPPPVAA